VKHPRGRRSVSLRASATDVADNTTELTIVDAYRIE